MPAATRPAPAAETRPAPPAPVHRHGPAHRHEAGHGASRHRPTALASAVEARLIRVGAALAVLWLAVAWALWSS
ncbi:MAG: hypothetical protein L6R19_18555 [Alphaproteobacteria bacterium]|nr:hypothetical protein [Alphaproteobacteria bacterium]